VDTTTIASLLTEYGWSCTAESDSVVTSRFLFDETELLVVVQWATPWLRLSIPHLFANLEPNKDAQFWHVISRLNFEARFVRFALSQQEQLGIYADLYADDGNLPFKQFEVALDAICYFAETAHNQLWALSATREDINSDV
jgi:hypothetical protein